MPRLTRSAFKLCDLRSTFGGGLRVVDSTGRCALLGAPRPKRAASSLLRRKWARLGGHKLDTALMGGSTQPGTKVGGVRVPAALSRSPPRPRADLAGVPSQWGHWGNKWLSLSLHDLWQHTCQPRRHTPPSAASLHPAFVLAAKQMGPRCVELKWPRSSLGTGPSCRPLVAPFFGRLADFCEACCFLFKPSTWPLRFSIWRS